MARFNLRRLVWPLHKYLSYLLVAQILLWVLGGVLFSSLPFKAWVKGQSFVSEPAQPPLPAEVSARLLAQHPQALSISARNSAQGTLVLLEDAKGRHWYNAQGERAGAASAEQLKHFARNLLNFNPSQLRLRQLEQSETRLGIVDELYGRTGLWQLEVDDKLRLYFGPEGQYVTVRTNYWVWYDLFWRFHLMDYSGGEDFNNTLLRVTAWITLLFVLTGLVLSYFAARGQWQRAWRKWRG